MLNPYLLETEIQGRMTAAKIPGLAVAIARGDEIIYAHGFGVTSVAPGGVPVTPETLFRIGSTTKPMVATMIMCLVERGKLDLDRPVREYLDWFRLPSQEATESATLRLLLSHTAGLMHAFEYSGPRDPEGLEANLRQRLPQHPMVAPPGLLWNYSNTGIDVAGCVAQTVTGVPFAELMRTLVFEPLHMHRSTFDPLVAMAHPLAISHVLSKEGVLQPERRFTENVSHYPAGFLFSNVLDVSNFCIMQMNQGFFRESPVLAPEALAEMQNPQADMRTVSGRWYGLAIGGEMHQGRRLIGHGGEISGFRTTMWFAPDDRASVVLMYSRDPLAEEPNSFNGDQLAASILFELLGLAPEPVATAEPDRSLWPLFEGAYLGTETGMAIVRICDGKLTVNLNGASMPLECSKRDLYFAGPEEAPASLGFVLDGDRPVRFISLESMPAERISFDSAFAPDVSLLQRYVGDYRDRSGIIDLRIELHEGGLVASGLYYGTRVPCIAVTETQFAGPFGTIDFLLSAGGQVERVWRCQKTVLYPVRR